MIFSSPYTKQTNYKSMANPLTRYVEQELGQFPHFILCAILEWLLMILLFLIGIIAFIATQFARFFDLRLPCLFCSRIDHIFLHNFHYSDSICESHKKDVSSLAYCHNHKKLSDVRRMCEVCLLSCATEKESEDNRQLLSLAMGCGGGSGSAGGSCCCCGEVLKGKSSKGKNGSTFSVMTPRAAIRSMRNEEKSGLELPHIRFTELKLSSENESEFLVDDYGKNLDPHPFKEDVKAVKLPLIPETEDVHENSRTPIFGKGNKFFGIPLTDSANNSPRFTIRVPRKSPLERTELADEPEDTSEPGDNDSIISKLRKQVRKDRDTITALYMELDEERSASDEAANNAMAMITHLQAEKAALQMEALQYQRMMEEQAEYDHEDLQTTNDLLTKREEEIEVLEAELEVYREKYGYLDGNLKMFEDEISDEDYHEFKSQSCLSSSDEKSECSTPFSITGKERNNFDKPVMPSVLTTARVLPFPQGKSEREDQNEQQTNLKIEEKNNVLSNDDGVSFSKSSAGSGSVNQVDEDTSIVI